MELKIDSAFFTRLVDVLASGVGALSRPWMIRRIASAQADAHRVKARAEQEIRLLAEKTTIELERLRRSDEHHLLAGGPEPVEDLRQRALARVEERELRRLHNIEAVVVEAATQDGPPPPADAPDPDWVARFFTAVQDVSVAEMQAIWGKILAGEIRQPGAFSLRTLDVVRNLSEVEAHVFQLVAGCVERTTGGLLFGEHSAKLLPAVDQLVEAGLFHARSMWALRSAEPHFLHYPGDSLEVVLTGNPRFLDLYDATSSAMQLLRVMKGGGIAGYVESLVRDLEFIGYKVTRLPAAETAGP